MLSNRQLPTLLYRAPALFWTLAHHLQHDEAQQDQPDMTDHHLLHPALARLQTAELLRVAEDGLYGPAAALTHNHCSEVCLRVARDDVLVVGVTVSGHCQPQVAVLGSIYPHRIGSQPELFSPSQAQLYSQFADLWRLPS